MGIFMGFMVIYRNFLGFMCYLLKCICILSPLVIYLIIYYGLYMVLTICFDGFYIFSRYFIYDIFYCFFLSYD